MKAFAVLLAGATLALAASAQGPSTARCTTAASADPSSPAQLIVGRWKHVELSRFQGMKKLSATPFQGENVVRFECDGTWALAGPTFQSSGTYRWIAPDQLEQKIVQSADATQRGQASIKRIVVDAKVLELHAEITAEDVNKSGPRARIVRPQDSVRAVSRFERLTGP